MNINMNNEQNVEKIKNHNLNCDLSSSLKDTINIEKSNLLKNLLLKKEEYNRKILTNTYEFVKPPSDFLNNIEEKKNNIINIQEILDKNIQKTNNIENLNKSLKKLKEELQSKNRNSNSKTNINFNTNTKLSKKEYFAQSKFLCSPEAHELPLPSFFDSDIE